LQADNKSKLELDVIRDVIRIERMGLERLESRVDESFNRAVDLIMTATGDSSRDGRCTGRLIISGLGKSGAISRKIAATLTSTGTPAIFVHPIEGAHGDFGLIQKGDVALVISKSGAGEELNTLLPYLKRVGVPVISVTHDLDSPLARHGDVVLDASIELEACPNGVAPTTSSTVALVIGDALAVALMKRRGFTKEDFARFHPAGALGRKLLLSVKDVLPGGRDLACVDVNANLSDVIMSITGSLCGATLVTQSTETIGIITDGDLRRYLMDGHAESEPNAGRLMSHNPKTIQHDKLAVEALRILNELKIQQIVVCDATEKAIGILHLHDLLSVGIR
jgi:arabinose-5-phosphate isomerase